jgi:uncharacterized protein YdeI (YjbR/CyaY-like superfamily)
MNPKVDWYFNKASKWQEVFFALREIILECNLVEALKWGLPCYTHNGKNILIIQDFKEYCAIMFFQGALLKDTKKILVQLTENVQSARQIRFTTLKEVLKNKSNIKTYIKEAVENEKAGKKVELKKLSDYPIPEEFKKTLNEMPELKKSFQSLTPGRQKGYIFYFSSAKQSKTREARIEKYIQHILDGKGIDD